MKWTAIARHRAGTTFVLVFFLVFAVLSGFLAADAVRVYRGIDRRADSTHSRAAALLYLSGAARRADTANGLGITALEDGTHALAVREGGKVWLYFCRDGALYKQAQDAPDSAAEPLCAAGSLRLRRVRGLLRADYTAPDGSRAVLLLAPRSAGGAP